MHRGFEAEEALLEPGAGGPRPAAGARSRGPGAGTTTHSFENSQVPNRGFKTRSSKIEVPNRSAGVTGRGLGAGDWGPGPGGRGPGQNSFFLLYHTFFSKQLSIFIQIILVSANSLS